MKTFIPSTVIPLGCIVLVEDMKIRKDLYHHPEKDQRIYWLKPCVKKIDHLDKLFGKSWKPKKIIYSWEAENYPE